MDSINNNKFEVNPVNSKRKVSAPGPSVYLNPALDLLASEDRMCNTAMEVPHKKRKQTKSCDIATFENSALDLGISKAAVNEFLVRELENVKRNLKHDNEDYNLNVASNNLVFNASQDISANATLDQAVVPYLAPRCRNPLRFDITNVTQDSVNNTQSSFVEPIYVNITNTCDMNTEKVTENTVDALESPDISRIPHDFEIDSGVSVLDQRSLTAGNTDSNVSNITNIQTNITNQVVLNNSNLSLSFIDRLALDSPAVTDQSLYLDDDLNESNIMEIKTITIITKKKRIVEKNNTNPFLNPNVNTNEIVPTANPFLYMNPDIEYHDEVLNRPVEVQLPNSHALVPKRLFSGDTNSTMSTMNDSSESHHDYENIDHFRTNSPIYENIEDANINKQSKILGCDVSQFSAIDIMNLNKNSQANSSNESEAKKDLKHSFLKASNKLSKKVFKTLKKPFKQNKLDSNSTINPYEVPRKLPKQKEAKKESGIENPALNLDNSDDIEIEELSDDEHQYETVKTRRNTQLNMIVTPLRVKDNDIDFLQEKNTSGKNTPGKKVRFDSTLNQEKVITGNSFDCGLQSPGFDAKIDKYHDELENCINERKFLQQNM